VLALSQKYADMMDFARQEQGTDAADVTGLVQSPANDAFRLSEREQSVLRLWDQEEEVRLEINLLEAQSECMLAVLFGVYNAVLMMSKPARTITLLNYQMKNFASK
jgi:hypothetical protein